MGLGYLISILLCAVIAAVQFSKLATRKGYSGPKARRYPLLLGLVAMFLSVVVTTTTALLGAVLPPWQGTFSIVYWVGNGFVIALYLVVLKKAYKNMKAAPDAGAAQPAAQTDREG